LTKRGLEVSRCAVTFCWQQANSLDKEQEYIYASSNCRVRGCPHTTTDSSGYCERHKSEGWKQYKPGQSRHQRGYGSKWDSIRARVLKRDKGLCQLCLRAGVVREAKTVDHIIPKAHGGTDADCNLQSLCWPCHKAKTARERLK